MDEPPRDAADFYVQCKEEKAVRELKDKRKKQQKQQKRMDNKNSSIIASSNASAAGDRTHSLSAPLPSRASPSHRTDDESQSAHVRVQSRQQWMHEWYHTLTDEQRAGWIERAANQRSYYEVTTFISLSRSLLYHCTIISFRLPLLDTYHMHRYLPKCMPMML